MQTTRTTTSIVLLSMNKSRNFTKATNRFSTKMMRQYMILNNETTFTCSLYNPTCQPDLHIHIEPPLKYRHHKQCQILRHKLFWRLHIMGRIHLPQTPTRLGTLLSFMSKKTKPGRQTAGSTAPLEGDTDDEIKHTFPHTSSWALMPSLIGCNGSLKFPHTSTFVEITKTSSSAGHFKIIGCYVQIQTDAWFKQETAWKGKKLLVYQFD